MGLDNRDYLRDEERRYSGGGGFAIPPAGDACKKIMIITIAVFVLQVLATRQWTDAEIELLQQEKLQELIRQRDAVENPSERLLLNIDRVGQSTTFRPESHGFKAPSIITEWLYLKTAEVFSGQVWRLVTCAFCHDASGLFHIFFNMFALYMFGPKVESSVGAREFVWFYLVSAVVASLSFLLLDVVTGSNAAMVGASGAVMAVITVFALKNPDVTINLFMVLPVKAKHMVPIFAAISLFPVLAELSGGGLGDGVAHIAHLGGLGFGFFYGKRSWKITPFLDRFSTKWRANRRGLKVVSEDPTPSAKSRKIQKLEDDMDAILAKISEHGESSLSNSERKILEKASRELRGKRG